MYRVHICSFSDPRDYQIHAGGKVWRFDWSDRFGPLLVDKSGRELKNQPTSERHPFLQAVSYWFKQGKRVGDDGLCVWDKPPPLQVRKDARGRRIIVGGEMDEIDPSNVIVVP